MANSNINQFNCYDDYLWQASDMTAFQQYLQDIPKGLAQAGFGNCVLTGLEVLTATGMTANVNVGVAVGDDGMPLVSGSVAPITIATPASFPARTLVVLRPVNTDNTFITNPTNPGGPQVPLLTQLSCQVVVLNGTPGVSPVYPSILAGDVKLIGFRLAAGQSTISQNDLDFEQRSVPKQRRKAIRELSADATLNVVDEVILVNAASGTVNVNLAAATSMTGNEVKVVKIDSSANPVNVNSADLISGQSTQTIDSQWGSIKAAALRSSYVSY